MNETLPAVVGLLLGVIFFGGLWWTVQRGVAPKASVLWFPVSLLLRTAVVVAGFYFVSNNDWRRILACCAGFLVARFLITLLTGPSRPRKFSSLVAGARR